jgi:hypothetical protein
VTNNLKLPENNSNLTEIFRNAATPDISEFNGEYLVDMLTVFPSFKRFSHRKVFISSNNKVSGYNILFDRKWGRFFLEEGICEQPEPLNVAVINYDRSENSVLTRRIRDHLRRIEEGIYLGRFNYLFNGRLHFFGYFSLEKIERQLVSSPVLELEDVQSGELEGA